MPATSRLSCERFRHACLAREGVAEVTALLLEFALRHPASPAYRTNAVSNWPLIRASPPMSVVGTKHRSGDGSLLDTICRLFLTRWLISLSST